MSISEYKEGQGDTRIQHTRKDTGPGLQDYEKEYQHM